MSVSGECRIVFFEPRRIRCEQYQGRSRGGFALAAQRLSPGHVIASMSAQMRVDSSDRYTVRSAEIDWCVWHTLRKSIVFGAERLVEARARALARRLNEAYRRALPNRNNVSSEPR